MRRFLVPVAVALVTCWGSPARAGIEVGEISSSRADALPTLRRAVQDEVAALDVKGDAVVSVSLVRLDTARGARGDTATCIVSAALRTRTGNVLAILEGHASAENTRPVTVETAAMCTAVHGAISRIPDALRVPRAGVRAERPL